MGNWSLRIKKCPVSSFSTLASQGSWFPQNTPFQNSLLPFLSCCVDSCRLLLHILRSLFLAMAFSLTSVTLNKAHNHLFLATYDLDLYFDITNFLATLCFIKSLYKFGPKLRIKLFVRIHFFTKKKKWSFLGTHRAAPLSRRPHMHYILHTSL